MTKQKHVRSTEEAMKLALEALEQCYSALAEELSAWDIDPPLHHVLEASNACGPAIIAIREALALVNEVDQEQPAPVAEPRKQEPEPVAWAMYQRDQLLSFWMDKSDAYDFEFTPEHSWTPLYTSQPANANAGKPWVGFTLPSDEWLFSEMLKRFEALVRADEREQCAQICESLFDMDDDSCSEAEQCAAAIRARKDEQ